jgi:hypothetical protein
MDKRKRWTVEQDRQLLELEQQGLSASLIADRMAKTRNAVIGRSYRLRGYRRLKANPTRRTTRTTVMKPNPGHNKKLNPAPPAVLAEPSPDPDRRMITILELTPRTCRWPHGERPPYLYCGAPPLYGKSYCEAHFLVSWK